MDIILYFLLSSPVCLILYSFDNYKERFCLGHLFSLLFFLSFFFSLTSTIFKSFWIHARLVSNTCLIGIKYMPNWYQIHARLVSNTCLIGIKYMPDWYQIHARLVSNTCPIGIKKINKKTKRSREKRIVLSGQVISSNKGLMLKNINLESLCANQFLLATCDYLNPHQLLQHYGFSRIINTSFMPNWRILISTFF